MKVNPIVRAAAGEVTNRRRFVATLLLPAVLSWTKAGLAWGQSVQGSHPTPRPGVNASKVLKREALHADADAIPVFDMVREIPQIIDGIRCNCGCAEEPEFYSLLSCFEGDGMARHCQVCQGQARLAFTMHGEGKGLKEIRLAIDARFGESGG
jgi:hypothetical protein